MATTSGKHLRLPSVAARADPRAARAGPVEKVRDRRYFLQSLHSCWTRPCRLCCSGAVFSACV